MLHLHKAQKEPKNGMVFRKSLYLFLNSSKLVLKESNMCSPINVISERDFSKASEAGEPMEKEKWRKKLVSAV